MRVSVIIPTRNEAQAIGHVLRCSYTFEERFVRHWVQVLQPFSLAYRIDREH